jgi:hypothetical protein
MAQSSRSPMEEKKIAQPAKRRVLDADDQIGLDEVKRYYTEETQKCEKLPWVTTLTEEEYNNASAEFKLLIEIPKKKNEPIYIANECTPDGKVLVELRRMEIAIKAGQPYHTFITASLGETWPLLMRLFYGLTSSNFKISIDQLHTMIKICYWRDRGFEIEYVNLFDKTDNTRLTEQGNLLVNNGMFTPNHEDARDKFVEAMRAADIPKSECSLQMVKLSPEYFRVAMMGVLKNRNIQTGPLLLVHDASKNVPLIGEYSAEKTIQFTKRNGAEIFEAAMSIGTAYYRMFFLRKDWTPVFLFPSQTMLKLYVNSLNHGRNLKVVRRLGAFGPRVMEQHSDQNERVINLFAPGISNPLVTHNQVVFPWAALEHDEYHALNEGRLSLINFKQLTRVKTILRQVTGDAELVSTEIFRSIDRERSPALGEKKLFLELVKYLFSTNIQRYDAKLKISSVILLVDMVLSPAEWPYYSEMKMQLITALLPSAKGARVMTFDAVKEVESKILSFASKTNNDYCFIAILLLSHYYLNDPTFCDALLALKAKFPAGSSFYAWRKQEHGHLYPLLILNGKEYPLENLVDYPARSVLLLTAEIPGASLRNELSDQKEPQASGIKAGEIEIDIPDFDSQKEKIIQDAGGEVITEVDACGMAKIKILSASLNKAIRSQLGLQRFALTFPAGKSAERSEYLRSAGIVVEATDTPDKFLVTFRDAQRFIVEIIKDSWNDIKALQHASQYRPLSTKI